MKKNIANILTASRILGSFLLLFFRVTSFEFFVTYIFCGLTDMIDGTVARKMNSAGEFGAKLDTLADFAFITIAIIKFLPLIQLPLWLWIWCGIIAIIKISNIIQGFIIKKRFIAFHSVMNKVTGFLLFLLPLTLSFVESKYSFIAVCLVATIASVQETRYIIL